MVKLNTQTEREREGGERIRKKIIVGSHRHFNARIILSSMCVYTEADARKQDT